MTDKCTLSIVLEKLQVNKHTLAKRLEVDPATVTRWGQREDGFIPQMYHARLMALAKELKKPLSWKDLSAV